MHIKMILNTLFRKVKKMNGSSTVFDNLEVRAKTAPSDPSLDRISIRDYIKEVEIGAFKLNGI
jgi:hypothetical protein